MHYLAIFICSFQMILLTKMFLGWVMSSCPLSITSGIFLSCIWISTVLRNYLWYCLKCDAWELNSHQQEYIPDPFFYYQWFESIYPCWIVYHPLSFVKFNSKSFFIEPSKEEYWLSNWVYLSAIQNPYLCLSQVVHQHLSILKENFEG